MSPLPPPPPLTLFRALLRNQNQRCYSLDEDFGDLLSIICDLEGQLIRQLEEGLLEHEGHLHDASESLAELDVLIGLSCVAHGEEAPSATVTPEL
jgi:DNA mismatch repair ATPase MutS